MGQALDAARFNRPRLRARPLATSALLCLALGCLAPRPATQVDVYVDAQPLVRSETRVLEVRISAGPPGELGELPDVRSYEQSTLRLPIDFTLVPLGGDSTRIFEVEATALDGSRRVITVARLRGGFTDHTRRTMRLTLEDRCRGITCAPGFTCRAGACVPLVDPTDDGGVVEMDAGTPDAPPLICATSEQCDDGVFCNGVETCRGGECQPGMLPDCDDGVACTTDICSGSGCNHLPDETACPAGDGRRCDVMTGCQYSTCDRATNCAPGPCEATRCEGTTCRRNSTCADGQECCGGMCVARDCDDTNPCTDDFCGGTAGSGPCQHVPATGTCDDGDACSVGEVCTALTCGGGTPRPCTDGNPCTRDSCDRRDGCVFLPDNSLPFDDGSECTVGDYCVDGMGRPGAENCSDGVACTMDACVGRACTHVPTNTLCTTAAGGTCDPVLGCQYPGGCSVATCIAASPCETAMCVGGSCVRAPRCMGTCCDGTCCVDDGNPCTASMCSGATCANVPAIGATCTDGNLCTNDACVAGTCMSTPICPPSTDPCRITTCTGGVCGSTFAGSEVLCNDGSACTVNDRCSLGTCAGDPIVCPDDGNPCTGQGCDTTSGCTYPTEPDMTPCGLMDFLTCTVPLCMGGACEPYVYCSGGSTCCPGGGCRPPDRC